MLEKKFSELQEESRKTVMIYEYRTMAIDFCSHVVARCYHFSAEISIKQDLVVTIDSGNFQLANVQRTAIFVNERK